MFNLHEASEPNEVSTPLSKSSPLVHYTKMFNLHEASEPNEVSWIFGERQYGSAMADVNID